MHFRQKTTKNSKKTKVNERTKNFLEKNVVQKGDSIRNIVSKIFSNSPIFIFSQISHSTFRIVWIMILIACLVGSIYNIQKYCYLYWKYPVIINFQIEQTRSLEFPAVTVCNLNRISKDHDRTPSNDGIMGTPLLYSERRGLYNCQNGSSGKNKGNENFLKFLMTFYGLDEERRFALGIDPAEFLEICVFNQGICSSSYLDVFLNFRYGNCITFNKRNEEAKPLLISEKGYKSGLQMKLKLHISEYLNTTHTEGAKIFIHEPRENPNPEEDGFFVSPGYEFTVSIKQTIYRRLPAPYKDHCFNYDSQSDNTMRSKNVCIRSCIQRKNFEICGCIDQTLGVMNELKLCNLTNKTEACCLDKVLQIMSRNGSTCGCNLPCRSVYYNEMVSKARLRSSEFCDVDSEDLPFCYQLRNHLKLNVYYSSLERHVYEQRAKLELTELVSFIGNELALWLGLSMIAIFEIVEKMKSIVKHIIQKSLN